MLGAVVTILAAFNAALNQYGYEAHPFAVKCYNGIKTMDTKFHLNYSDNTLALTVIAAPDMFEKAMKPFICKSDIDEILKKSPTDECNKYYLQKFWDKYSDTDFLSSYKMLGLGHPVILSQTAAHVSGAAYYYQRKDVPEDTWPANKTIYGFAIHPRYGGWVRIPGVIVFKNVMLPSNFTCLTPPDVVPTVEKRIQLLNEVNNDWSSWKFADIIPVEKKYTPEAKKYFSSYGEQRDKLLKDISKRCYRWKIIRLILKYLKKLYLRFKKY
ncbi:Hypothetical predicted protein [Octopus vulgaris]|uniref:Cyanocobalamin reductase (cyanide-eliminating) n=2 Tax=Octopus vulgaris TaxID=6645 RepID=A0AA36B325_OCTVU|nr:Hypothetical predicted protein [Octopus vulgaris]